MRLGKFGRTNKIVVQRVYFRFFRYFEYTIQNPAWLLMFLLGRFNLIRNFVSLFYRAKELDKYQEEDSLFKDLEVAQAVESLQQLGYYLGINLPPDVLNEITHFAYSSRIKARNCPNLSFIYADQKQLKTEDSTNTFVHGTYTDVRSRISAIKKLENDPKLLKIAAQYLDCEPALIRTDLSWCFVAERSLYEKNGAAQILFHYDLDDYHALKFFFFITDVDLSSGPHVCIRGSHKKKKLMHQLSFLIGRSDDEIVDYYGKENLVTIQGQAGFGFAEDTFCFHRGTPPIGKDRLMLQIEFAVNNYGMWN
jgi:hypothetical protein